MPVKALTIPIVVPSRPTNGAVAPTVASTPEAALQLDDLDQHLALDRALGRVDVGDRDRAVQDERLHFGERAAEHAGDVRLLVALGQLDGLGEVVLLEELRELGRELARFLLRLAKVPPLPDDGERPDGHEQEDRPRGTLPKNGVCAQISAKSRFISRPPVEERTYLVIANENGCCTSCFTFLPPTSAGMNRMRGSAFFTAVVKSSWVDC